VLTMLDPQVELGLVPSLAPNLRPEEQTSAIHKDQERAKLLKRNLEMHAAPAGDLGTAIVRWRKKGKYDLIIFSQKQSAEAGIPHFDADFVLPQCAVPGASIHCPSSADCFWLKIIRSYFPSCARRTMAVPRSPAGAAWHLQVPFE